MHRFVLTVCLILGMALPASAQTVARTAALEHRPLKHTTASPGVLHVTRALIESPDGQEALRLFKEWKESGAPPLRKSGGSRASIGQVQTFLIQNIVTSENDAVAVDFTLVFEHAAFDIWVETSQLSPSGPVQQSDIDAMAEALGTSTPSGSFNPNQGIIVNDEAIFGPPPNVDGDGKTDVLLHDITDLYDPGNGQLSAVLGYFDPSDLSRYNFRDIIHIDIMPGMFDQNGNRRNATGVQQTLAHEYQHLIFANVNPTADAAFVDEGLAEWAEVQNGFTARRIDYLTSRNEQTRRLMEFRPSPQFGGPGGEDYQRAGLFTNYFSERVGVLETGALARSTGTNEGNYIVELNRLTGNDGVSTLKTFVQGFHIANVLNDRSVASNYGYVTPQYAGIQATGFASYDGTATTSTSAVSGSTNAGGVVYAEWTDVGNFSVSISSPGAGAGFLRPVAIGIPDNGPVQIVDVAPNGEGGHLTGNFAKVILVVPHVDIATTTSASFSYNANWSPKSGGVTFEDIAYDTGSVALVGGAVDGYSLNPSLGLPEDARFANRFVTPAGMRLESISVAVLYDNQFSNSTATSNVKNFRIRLYGATSGATPLPDTELLSLDVTDFATNQPPELSFHEVDLSAHEEVLQNLPQTFFVSVENAGTDDNYLFVGLSPFAQADNPGALYFQFSGGSDFSWGSFNTISSNGETILDDRTVPIRARFSDRAFNVADEDPTVLPETTILSPNYPNPFNPSTTISYSLPSSGPVRLAVHDMLGREVAVLVDGMTPAGTHQVRFDASSLTSGLYLYTLETPSDRHTRSMLLIK